MFFSPARNGPLFLASGRNWDISCIVCSSDKFSLIDGLSFLYNENKIKWKISNQTPILGLYYYLFVNMVGVLSTSCTQCDIKSLVLVTIPKGSRFLVMITGGL